MCRPLSCSPYRVRFNYSTNRESYILKTELGHNVSHPTFILINLLLQLQVLLPQPLVRYPKRIIRRRAFVCFTPQNNSQRTQGEKTKKKVGNRVSNDDSGILLLLPARQYNAYLTVRKQGGGGGGLSFGTWIVP